MAIELPGARPSTEELPGPFSKLEPHLQRMAATWGHEREYPPGNDSRLAALAQTALHMLGHDTRVGEVVDIAFSLNPDRAAAGVSRRWAQALQQRELDEMARDPNRSPSYPHDFTQPRAWRDAIDHALGDETSRLLFGHELLLEPLTNVVGRYKSIMFAALIQQARTNSPPSILDIGCSQGFGLTALDLQVDSTLAHNFDPIMVEGAMGIQTQGRYNRLLRRPFALGPSVGVDLHEPRKTIKRVRSSFYPSELLDPRTLEIFDLLASAQTDHVSFLQGDFSDMDGEDVELSHYIMQKMMEERNGGCSFNIASLVTVLNQCTLQQREAMFLNALKYTTPDGFVVVQDFIVPPKPGKTIHSPADFEFVDSAWGRFNYGTYVYDRANPAAGFQPLMNWRDGRCMVMRPPEHSSPLHAELNALLYAENGTAPRNSVA